jgi:hypothetical protein
MSSLTARSACSARPWAWPRARISLARWRSRVQLLSAQKALRPPLPLVDELRLRAVADGRLIECRHADGGGLYLVVDGHGKRWVFMWTKAGKRTEMGLGPLRDVGLAEARELASAARAAIRKGLDPKEVRNRTVPTFGACADAYTETMAPQFKNAKHLWQWRQTLGDSYCRAIRSKPVDQITTEDVLAILQPIWLDKNETAARLRGRIERVLDAARAKGLRSGENPARWRGHLDAGLDMD